MQLDRWYPRQLFHARHLKQSKGLPGRQPCNDVLAIAIAQDVHLPELAKLDNFASVGGLRLCLILTLRRLSELHAAFRWRRWRSLRTRAREDRHVEDQWIGTFLVRDKLSQCLKETFRIIPGCEPVSSYTIHLRYTLKFEKSSSMCYAFLLSTVSKLSP